MKKLIVRYFWSEFPGGYPRKDDDTITDYLNRLENDLGVSVFQIDYNRERSVYTIWGKTNLKAGYKKAGVD